MGGCQNYGPFLGTLNSKCRIIVGTQKGTIILTSTHVALLHVVRGRLLHRAIQNDHMLHFRSPCPSTLNFEHMFRV